MVLVVSVPYQTVSKPNKEYLEFYPDEINDDVFHNLLVQSYEMFKFFCGPFIVNNEQNENINGEMIELIRRRAAHFFSRYVPTIKPNNANIHSVLRAVQFLTLESGTFLKVQTFVNRIENHFRDLIKHSIFLHQGNLVWSGLQQYETSLLYIYYNNVLLHQSRKEAEENKDVNNPFTGHRGRFLAGPINLRDTKISNLDSIRIPKIKVGPNLDEYHLIVYGALQSAVCLTVPSHVDLTLDFFRRLDAFLGPTLTQLSADLMIPYNNENTTNSVENDVPKFIYYNAYNKALKTTLSTHNNKNEYLKVIEDLSTDLKASEKFSKNMSFTASTEISVKVKNDQWVVGRLSDQRQVYVIITNKNANLIDISNQVEKLISSEFKKVCLLDK